jgi:hypothetical protein
MDRRRSATTERESGALNMPKSLGGGVFCEACQFAWAVILLLGCSYIVFWKGHSGWWFALAVPLMITKCRPSSPESEPRDE